MGGIVMKELYEKLYTDADTVYRYDKQRVGLSELSHFVAMKGCKFDQDDVRLFVIGRAVNGWETLPCETAQAFSEAAEKEFHAAGFTWIADNGDSFYSLHNIPEDGEPTYYLSKSPFWRTVETIWRELTGSDEFRFIDHIAWSNLYKIAPKESGNPTNTMCKKQFAACRDILEAEIREYNPTHILFIIGYDWWYADPVCDFSTLFLNNKRIGSNNEDKSIYAEGTAEYSLNGRTIPVVIACRPEMRDETAFTSAVVAAFRR
jgi:hypothetical protein